jgi:hypothetical protein
MILAISWWIAALSIFGAAFAWGDRPEREGAAVILAAYLLTPLAGQWEAPGLALGVFLVDTVLAGALVFVALRNTRWWTLVAAANQCLVVLAHLTPWMDDSIWTRAAIASRMAFGLVVLAALGIGLIEHRVARAAGFSA